MISVTWRYLSNRKGERTWSHSFLLADFAGRTLESTFPKLKVFYNIPQDMTGVKLSARNRL